MVIVRCAKQRSNLRDQKLGVTKTEPYGPQSERWIFLPTEGRLQILLSINVERPDICSCGSGCFCDSTIFVSLFILGRDPAVFADQTLRSIKADPERSH